MSSVKQKQCIMIISGEASGDIHGSKLVKSMRRKNKNLFFCGIGGSALKKEGVRILFEAEKISVVGMTEVIPKLISILKGLILTKRILKSLRPDLLILIDFPDFNINVAATAKKLNIPVLYYISPQIWAWRSGRVKKIKKRVDHVAVILPFEEKYYKKHNVPVTFVGHPLLDKTNVYNSKDKIMKVGDTPVIGLVPGSRDGEVTRHLPIMLDTASIIQERIKKAKFNISVAPTVKEELVEDILKENKQIQNVKIVTGSIDTFLRKCVFVIAVSGTVTLETAISGVPMLIIYKMSWLSYVVARLLIKGVKYVGLVNLVAGKSLVPEMLQSEAEPEKIADKVLEMMKNKNKIDKLKNDLLDVRKKLGDAGASDRVAEIAIHMMRF
ncbi:MAG: lipid-A-disaccharide synthase [Deltaproteobacteria bacterium]|nr:lipid-A-disaccharide synthase [Deltaproteobacteria bacterium]MBW1846062.1 lipid-A-disaccharide synthase [Deltaproteobacteria bacterium]MBW2363717.1 lipid-A-disaccharide synthase [Deltaproteobacteria bacterium]